MSCLWLRTQYAQRGRCKVAKKCELIVGYLIPHRCGRKAVAVCVKCGRGVCEMHAHTGDAGVLCRDCYEGQQAQVGSPVGGAVYGPAYTVQDYGLFDQESEQDTFSTLT